MGKEFGDLKLNKNGLQVGENSNSCCLCIEINAGVMIIGILVIVAAFLDVFNLITDSGQYNQAGIIISIVFTLPLVYAAAMFFQWLRKRGDSSRKGKLPGAVGIVVLSRLVMGVYWLIMVFFGADIGSVLKFLISFGIEFLLFAYYYGVVKRFAGK